MSVDVRFKFSLVDEKQSIDAYSLAELIYLINYASSVEIVEYNKDCYYNLSFNYYGYNCNLSFTRDNEEYNGIRDYELELNVFHISDTCNSSAVIKKIISLIGMDNITKMSYEDEGWYP